MQRKSAYILFLAVLGLLAIGIVILFSTGALPVTARATSIFTCASTRSGSGSVWGLLAGGLIDYHFWQRTWWVWFAVALVGLVLCFLPPLRHKINGSWRWLAFHNITCQPSEFAKIAAVFFLAYWFSRYEPQSKQIWRGFVFPMAVISLLLSLIITEVDLGTTILISATAFVVMFIAGTNLAVLATLSLGGIGSIFFSPPTSPSATAGFWPFFIPKNTSWVRGCSRCRP